MPRSRAATTAFVALAIVFVLLAILYAVGAISVLASGNTHHYKHAVVLVGLAVVALVASSFARPHPV